MIANITGVDFSGAQDAGRKIWLCETHAAAESLAVLACFPARELAAADGRRAGVERAAAFAALRRYIAAQPGTLFALDCPPGLPRAVMLHDTWRAMVDEFAADYPDAAAFRVRCRAIAGGREIKRRTDRETRTPFCVYNLRLYRQTYYGIRDLIAPLVRDDAARVLPMQAPQADKPLLVEACPSTTLRTLGLRAGPYKGRDDRARTNRATVLARIIEQYAVTIPDDIAATAIADPEGDALDSLIAALSLWHYLHGGLPLLPDGDDYAVEGYVYADC